MLKLSPKKRYKFYDTFIKSCEYINGKGECKTSRKSVKCINDKCEKVVIPKNKKEILQDFYKKINSDGEDEQWFNNHHLKQSGGAIDPPLKKEMIKNLAKKYKCPLCNSYKYKDSFLQHTQAHLDKKKLPKIKIIFKKPVKSVEKSGDKNISDKTKEILRQYIKDTKIHGQIGGADMRRFTVDTHFSNIYSQFGSGSQDKGDDQDQDQDIVRVRIPEKIRKTAFYAFKLKELGFNGGNIGAWNFAKKLVTKNYISIEDMRYMRNWFSGHLKISYPIYKKWYDIGRPKDSKWHTKNSIVLWVMRGGNHAFKWINSDKNIKLLNSHFNTDYKKLKI
jgi:hypothetical protein